MPEKQCAFVCFILALVPCAGSLSPRSLIRSGTRIHDCLLSTQRASRLRRPEPPPSSRRGQERSAQERARPQTRSRGSRASVSTRWRNRIQQPFGTYQVVSEKLHDEGGVLVALLAQGVKLCRPSARVIPQHATSSVWYAPAMASSKASLARWQAWSGELRIS